MNRAKKIALFAVGDAGWQGGIQYITNILYALNHISDEQPIEVHLFKKESQHFPAISEFNKIKLVFHSTDDAFPPLKISNKIRWKLQRVFTSHVNPRLENYFISNHFDFVFPANFSDCKGKLNVASWIADFQYHHFPDGANPRVTGNAERLISGIAHNSSKIILSSKFCERDAHRLFPVTKGKTFVMPFAVHIDPVVFKKSEFGDIAEKYSLPEKFFIVSNLFAPTKNHKTIFDAMGILKKKGVDINLVCTGNIVDYRNESFPNEILQMLTENKIRQNVHLLGLIPRQDQLSLFRMSTAILQPSINEGWNTSVEEAKALGKHLLMSDIEVHQEQYPGNPNMFSSLDANDLADKMNKLWMETSGQSFPDIQSEQKAFTAYQENIRLFGTRILEIAAS